MLHPLLSRTLEATDQTGHLRHPDYKDVGHGRAQGQDHGKDSEAMVLKAERTWEGQEGVAGVAGVAILDEEGASTARK